MSLNRIVFVGDESTGKREAIQSLCDSGLHENPSFQYGLVDFGNEHQLQLVNIKDMEVLNNLQKRVNDNNLGFVVLVDNESDDYLKKLISTVERLRPFFCDNALAIGFVARQKPAKGQIETINKRMRDLGVKAPVFEIEPNQRDDIALLLQALLISADCQLSTLH